MQESMRKDSIRTSQKDQNEMNQHFKRFFTEREITVATNKSHDEELKFSGVNFDYLACRRL